MSKKASYSSEKLAIRLISRKNSASVQGAHSTMMSAVPVTKLILSNQNMFSKILEDRCRSFESNAYAFRGNLYISEETEGYIRFQDVHNCGMGPFYNDVCCAGNKTDSLCRLANLSKKIVCCFGKAYALSYDKTLGHIESYV